jgi:hypothetical protein
LAIDFNANRFGFPNYITIAASALTFIEVKGASEKIRDTQIPWLQWLKNHGQEVKILRVKAMAA